MCAHALLIVHIYIHIFACRHKRTSLRVLGTVGEPINPEAWLWYYNVVGNSQCAIVDTFWQTETVSLFNVPISVFCIFIAIPVHALTDYCLFV